MRDIGVVEVDGDICVDFRLSPKKRKDGKRVSQTAYRVIKALFLILTDSAQSHNKTPQSVFRVVTRFNTHRETYQFIKRYGGQNILSHLKFR